MSFDLKIQNGDLSISQDGLMDIVVDNGKLRQDIIKILLTKLGENKYHPSYGSEIGSLSIGMVADQELLELDLQSSVRDSVNKLIALQKSQSRKQFITPGERILALIDSSVQRDNIDPRLYNIFITVQTGAMTPITESLTIRII
jgi:phage baseplate assembly protein W